MNPQYRNFGIGFLILLVIIAFLLVTHVIHFSAAAG